MFCENCGKELPDGSKFCNECGAKVLSDEEWAQAVGAASQPAPLNRAASMQQGNTPAAVNAGSQIPGTPMLPPGQAGMNMTAQYSQNLYNSQQVPPMPQKKKGSALPVILIILFLLVAGVVFGIVMLGKFIKGKIEGAGEALGELVAAELTDEDDDDDDRISKKERDDDDKDEKDDKDDENGTVDQSGAYGIVMPSSAVPVSEAGLSDLIGEYEGEMQFMILSGFDKIEGAPADIAEMVQEGLDKPCSCTLEIEDDGDWELYFDFMHGMSMEGRDFKLDNPKTPGEEKAHMITEVENGMYNVLIEVSEDENNGRIEHKGIYCDDNGKKMISGYFQADLSMGDVSATVGGYFNVYKTTEDYIPETDSGPAGGTDEGGIIPTGDAAIDAVLESARNYSQAPYAELEDIMQDGSLVIRVYEDAGDHQVTWDRYYIDITDMCGENEFGASINLSGF